MARLCVGGQCNIVAEVMSKIRVIMFYMGELDERIQIICGMIDRDIATIAKIRARGLRRDESPAGKSKVFMNIHKLYCFS